jgi:type IV secretory pathway TrbL component
MTKSKRITDNLFYVAIAAMVLLVFAVSFIGFGTILQKSLFLIGAFVLFFVASLSNQKVLQALQIVVVIGAVMSFFQLGPIYALGIMLFVAVVLVVYLYSIEHYKKEQLVL